MTVTGALTRVRRPATSPPDLTMSPAPLSERKKVVERYIDGFRRADHSQILSCLTDDVEWVLHGHKTIRGKAAFDAEIENDAFDPHPQLHIGRLIEDSETVVATGQGSIAKKTGETLPFAFCEVFTFRGNHIKHLETYHLWLTPQATGWAAQPEDGPSRGRP